MMFRSTIRIVILRTSLTWAFFTTDGLINTQALAVNNANHAGEDDQSIMQNTPENLELVQNSTELTSPNIEPKTRTPHSLKYHSEKQDASHQTLNDFRKEPTAKSSKWLYPNISPAQEKINIYEDFYNLKQPQQSEVKFSNDHNSIPRNVYTDDYTDYENYAEKQNIQNWRNSYYPLSGGTSYGCSCYKSPTAYNEINKENGCHDIASTFFSILGTLTGNLWQLIKIVVTISIPFVVPMLLLKLILIPLKILKFIKLIKLLFKIFVVLPFVIRNLYPAISNGLANPNLFFARPLQAAFDYNNLDSREESHDPETRNTNILEYIENYSNTSDDEFLRACPSRVACELGSYLITSTKYKFPDKLVKYLRKRAEVAEKIERTIKKGNSLETEKESAVRAFIIALGKKFSMEQCAVHRCGIML